MCSIKYVILLSGISSAGTGTKEKIKKLYKIRRREGNSVKECAIVQFIFKNDLIHFLPKHVFLQVKLFNYKFYSQDNSEIKCGHKWAQTEHMH